MFLRIIEHSKYQPKIIAGPSTPKKTLSFLVNIIMSSIGLVTLEYN